MRGLYPEISPNKTYHLDVGDGHTVYMEESGNSSGIPVIFIHGGPGGGSTEKHRRYFNPKKYHIINFDQRGAHRSTPGGRVEFNTTWDLVDDIETIRRTLNIDKYLLFGGSWGATLALLYAQTHPDRVKGMILRGSFLARGADLQWFAQKGANQLLPEQWDKFLGVVKEDGPDLISNYYKRIHGDDRTSSMTAAREWADWNARVVTYLMFEGELDKEPDDITLDNAKIETHYAVQRYFLDDNQILRDINKLPDVPIRIIHGRRDITCTPDASWQLHKAISGSELKMIQNAGHLASDKAICDALIQATDDYVKLLQ